MDDPLTQSFLQLFDLSGLLAFLGGILATWFYCWAKDRYNDRKHPIGHPHRTQFRSMLVLWMLVYVVVGYIAINQQAQSITVHQLAADTEKCQQQFVAALRARSEANDRNDEWSRIKTREIAAWMHELAFPPPDMVERRVKDPNDPVYIRWALRMTEQHFDVINIAENEQAQAAKDRELHPLPEPKCAQHNFKANR